MSFVARMILTSVPRLTRSCMNHRMVARALRTLGPTVGPGFVTFKTFWEIDYGSEDANHVGAAGQHVEMGSNGQYCQKVWAIRMSLTFCPIICYWTTTGRILRRWWENYLFVVERRLEFQQMLLRDWPFISI